MKLALCRIDDRLVHGQVVQGCCGPLQVQRILLANDEAAADPLQTRLYRGAAPPEVEVLVQDLDRAARSLRNWQAEDDPAVTLLVVESPGDLLRLIRSGVAIHSVNLGGLHYRSGTRELWPGFYLDDQARADLRTMLDMGIDIEVQTVPAAPAIDARSVLEHS